MPELPEVETVRQELLPHVIGRSISKISLGWSGIVRQPQAGEFKSIVIGRAITKLNRYGKYLVFHLEGDVFLVMHLRMTGSLIVSKDSEAPPKHNRATIYLDNGKSIFFRDPRKFGRMWLVENPDEVLRKLGPEPLTPSFTAKKLGSILAKRKAPVKAVLLDQHTIAGIGNMYADEILFASYIHPERAADSLAPEEVKRVHRNIRQILRAAIISKGASVANYIRPNGELGSAHYSFKVAHHLGGDTCPRCGGTIKRITVRNRGTYFCPGCQK